MNPSVLKVDLGRECGCGKNEADTIKAHIGTYDAMPIVSAVIPIQDYCGFEPYRDACKKRYKGNVLRDADRAGDYWFYAFQWENHIPDIVEINHSKMIRSGGGMREHYLKSVEEMGGAPKKAKWLECPSCKQHWRVAWGIFERISGYKQGDVVTNGKLLAYVSMVRAKDLAYYAMILGHGDYLKYGIMYKLHLSIVQMILDFDIPPYLQGIKVLMYGAWESGGEGLKLWKKKTLFEPAYLVEV